MTDISSLMGSMLTFASLMAGISIAVERAVEMIKGAVPPLANTWTKNDQVRAGIVQLIAAALGAGIASQMPDQVRNAMPPGLAGPLQWPAYAVLGLMASGGSGAWNHVLDILGAIKTKQEALASAAQVPATSASGPGPVAALSNTTAAAASLSLTGATQATAQSTAVTPVAKAATVIGFAPPSASAPRTVASAAGPGAAVLPSNPPAPKPAVAAAPIASTGSRQDLVATRKAASIYPGRIISTGDSDARTIRLIQHRLNQVGCGPVDEDGVFGQQTKEAVELYQIRSADHFGLPLKVDGEVGPLTWYSLFAMPEIPATLLSSFTPPTTPLVATVSSPLLAATLKVAAGEIGVMEDPLGSNRGPRVDDYLRSVGVNPATGSYPWCAAFVYFCFQQAAKSLGMNNPAIKTDGVLDHWNKAGLANIKRLDTEACIANPSLVSPGMIFVIIHPGGTAGHMGLVREIAGNLLTTIEGNTNDNGSREGIGVFLRNQRTIASINRGFICY